MKRISYYMKWALASVLISVPVFIWGFPDHSDRLGLFFFIVVGGLLYSILIGYVLEQDKKRPLNMPPHNIDDFGTYLYLSSTIELMKRKKTERIGKIASFVFFSLLFAFVIILFVLGSSK